MRCRRCKTVFDYDSYYGICPKCAYFNRPEGQEEVDLFEDDDRFAQEDYHFPEMEADNGTYPGQGREGKTARKKRPKRSNGRQGLIWKLMLILIAVFIVSGIVSGLLYGGAEEDSEAVEVTEAAEDTDERTVFTQGESILLPDGKEVWFTEVRTVAVSEDAGYLPEGKKLVRAEAVVHDREEEGETYLYYDGPCLKNDALYCYPVSGFEGEWQEDGAETQAVPIPEVMEDYFVDFNQVYEGSYAFYYVVDEGLTQTMLHLSASEETNAQEPDYMWDVAVTIEENTDER